MVEEAQQAHLTGDTRGGDAGNHNDVGAGDELLQSCVPDHLTSRGRQYLTMELRSAGRPRTYLALVRAATLAAFVVTGPSIPSRALGAAALYVVGACVLGALRPKYRGLDITLLVATVCADIAWCTVAFVFYGPLDSLPAVLYAAAMAAMAAWISPVAAAAIGLGSAAVYCACVFLIHKTLAVGSVMGQLVAFQTATMALAGLLSACIADQWARLRRTRAMVERLERLNLATADAAATRGDDEVKVSAVKHAVETVYASRAWIMRKDADAGLLRLEASYGSTVPEDMAEATEMDEGLAGEAIRTHQPVLLHAAIGGTRRLSAIERKLTCGQVLAVPLPDGDDVAGALVVTKARDASPFSEEDVAVLTLLGRSIGGALHTAGLIRDLHHSSTTDSLTGLLNHGAFFKRLSDQVRQARELEEDLSLIVLDLDGFKQVNDTVGHWQGDRLLKALAEALSRNFRDGDIIGRCGGDEFGVLLPSTTPERAVEIARRAADALRASAVAMGLKVPVSASWGVASFPLDSTTDEGLFQQADARLYEAKDRGGDHVAFLPDAAPRVLAQI